MTHLSIMPLLRNGLRLTLLGWMRQKLALLGCVVNLLGEPSSKSWLVQLSPKIQSIIYPIDLISVTIKKKMIYVRIY